MARDGGGEGAGINAPTVDSHASEPGKIWQRHFLQLDAKSQSCVSLFVGLNANRAAFQVPVLQY